MESDGMTPTNETGVDAAGPVFHGYRGPEPALAGAFVPPFSIAVNRQTGARGRQVAERAAQLLGYNWFTPDAVELAAQDPNSMSSIDGQAAEWIERRTAWLAESTPLGDRPEMQGLVKTLLEIATVGQAVIVGKGSTVVLPPESTLRVRIVAPELARSAFIAQWERLSHAEASQYVQERDESRRLWLLEHFGVDQDQPEQYDLTLNSTALGVEGCARILAAAIGCKPAI